MGDATIEALRTMVEVSDNAALVQLRAELQAAQEKIKALERNAVVRFRKEAFQYAHVVLEEANAMLPQQGMNYQHMIGHTVEVLGAKPAYMFLSPPSQHAQPQESYILIEENGIDKHYHIYMLAELQQFASKYPHHFNQFSEKVTSCQFNFNRDTPSDGYADV